MKKTFPRFHSKAWFAQATAPGLFSALALCGCGSPEFAGDTENGEDATAQVRQYIVGGAVTWQRPEVGWWGQNDTNGRGLKCTATLIHRQFVISAAHCNDPSVTPPADKITFYTTSGTQLTPIAIDNIWSIPAHPDFPKYGNSATLNSDILLAHLQTPVSESDIVPAIIANNWSGADNTTVSVFGFGNFTTGTCPTANNYDYQKRAVNFPWGQPWPVCNGDSGGPTFNAAIPSGQLISVNGSNAGAGSVVRYREDIYEHMRQMLGASNGVPGIKRNGVVLTSAANSSAAACEFSCQWRSDCRAWSYTTQGATCTLLSAVGGWVPDQSATSGLANRATTGASNDISQPAVTVPALSASDCAAQCSRPSANCSQYNFTIGNCNMYTSVTSLVSRANYTTGFPLKGVETGFDRPNGNIRSVTIDPILGPSCALQCEQTEECRAYTYVPSTSKCWLKWAVSSPVANSSTISGVKRPPAFPNTFMDGTAIQKSGAFKLDPASAFYVPVPARAEQCRADCATDQTCVAYNIQKPAYGQPVQCRLLSKVTSENVNAPGGGGYDSSYKGLTYY